MDDSCISHQPCTDCGSSDALAIYEDHSHCYSCQAHRHFDEQHPRPEPVRTRLPSVRAMKEFLATPWQAPYRNLDVRTLEQYGIQLQDTVLVFQYRDKDGKICARKWRTADKKRVWWDGDNSAITGFGSHLANPAHHDAIAICEGEIDAPSITQATGGKVIGISVPNGAGNATAFIKKQLDFYLQFKVIYVATDMDEPGEKAAKELVSLFDAGKVRRVIFPKKDANDTLTELGSMAVRDAVMAAKESRPDGIRPASDYQGLVLKPPQRKATDSAFVWWNQKTPFYDNQLIVLVAGSGVGKTTFARALALGLMEKGKKVGWIGLEETVDEAIFRFVGMAAGIQLHARQDYAGITDEEMQRIAQADRVITGSGRLELFDHFGSLDENSILQRMNYMVRSLGCEFLFLDHLTILGSGLAQDTRHLDALVTRIRSFIAATKCTVIAINHLNRGSSQSKNMEDGGIPELHDIRGSHSIVQLADTIWALGRKRGQQTTHSYCLKNRMLGRCGYAGSFAFDEATQNMEQVWEDPTGNPF
jgi:twinkle protein